MLTAEIACPKCKQPMQAGFVLSNYQSYGAVASWIEGLPQYGPLGGLRFRGKPRTPIMTYRCPACGYLESYAK